MMSGVAVAALGSYEEGALPGIGRGPPGDSPGKALS